MVVMMMLGGNREMLGDHTLTCRHRWLGWLATGVMGLAVVAMVQSWLSSWLSTAAH